MITFTCKTCHQPLPFPKITITRDSDGWMATIEGVGSYGYSYESPSLAVDRLLSTIEDLKLPTKI